MRGFRIALKKLGPTPKEAFKGKSGYVTDGRWHSRGRYLDYAAESLSLATLERLVHYKRFDRLDAHVLYELEIPDAQIETIAHPPAGWEAIDLSPAAQAIGNAWCDEAKSPALQVRSAVTPGEHNLLLNSRHPAWNWKWVVAGPRPFEFDARLVELIKK